jgi:hypothetical protein
MPVILATQEAEIRRIMVQSQPGQTVCNNLPQKKPSQKRAREVTQGVGPDFKPLNHKKGGFLMALGRKESHKYKPQLNIIGFLGVSIYAIYL